MADEYDRPLDTILSLFSLHINQADQPVANLTQMLRWCVRKPSSVVIEFAYSGVRNDPGPQVPEPNNLSVSVFMQPSNALRQSIRHLFYLGIYGIRCQRMHNDATIGEYL